MIKGIVFDKDGTLLEYMDFWLPVARGAIKQLLSARKLDDAMLDTLLDAAGVDRGILGVFCYGTYGDIVTEINRVLTEAYPKTVPFDAEELASAVEDVLSLGVLRPTCADIVGVFRALRDRGLKIALATSDNLPVARLCLSRLGILDAFDAIYADDGIHPSKPDPYYLHLFYKEFDLRSDEVLMVGDTVSDMRFACAAGAHPIGVAKTEEARTLLLSHAECVLHDISYLKEILD